MEKDNLWEAVADSCLKHAKGLLKEETVPTAETVETVKQLVGIAIAIDDLNLRREEQNRFCAAGHLG